MRYPIITRHLLLLLAIAITPTAGAAMYRWVDDNGQTHFGDVIPPEYAEKRKDEFNDQGFIINTIEKQKSPEELAAEIQRLEAEKTAQEAAADQKKADDLLLKIYETEDALLLTRDLQLDSIDNQQTLADGQLRDRERILAQLQKEAAERERAGQQPGKKLLNDITTTQRQINELRPRIEELHRQTEMVRARFDADLARYRKLHSGD